MLSFLRNLFGRQTRRSGWFGRERQTPAYGRRGGMALGTLASIAAPFVIRKLLARRAQRTAAQPA
jgi:hypothetical protein